MIQFDEHVFFLWVENTKYLAILLVTLLGWLSDLQLGHKQVTLNHLVEMFFLLEALVDLPCRWRYRHSMQCLLIRNCILYTHCMADLLWINTDGLLLKSLDLYKAMFYGFFHGKSPCVTTI